MNSNLTGEKKDGMRIQIGKTFLAIGIVCLNVAAGAGEQAPPLSLINKPDRPILKFDPSKYKKISIKGQQRIFEPLGGGAKVSAPVECGEIEKLCLKAGFVVGDIKSGAKPLPLCMNSLLISKEVAGVSVPKELLAKCKAGMTTDRKS